MQCRGCLTSGGSGAEPDAVRARRPAGREDPTLLDEGIALDGRPRLAAVPRLRATVDAGEVALANANANANA